MARKPALASSNVDCAARLTKTLLLGNIAVRFAGKKLEWDVAKMRFINSDPATNLVNKSYRRGGKYLN